MTPEAALEKVEAAARAEGLSVLGVFEPGADDGAPEGTRGLALIGPTGPAFWEIFAASPEAQDGAADPLDRWSRRVGDALAGRLGATARYPFGGPPYAPFLRWALRSGLAWPSPLGMLIHAERGLWISYRFALCFRAPLADLGERVSTPCERCVDRPCLLACPVGAIGQDAQGEARYDVTACADHLRSDAGRDCLTLGCRARRACPVGRAFEPRPEQAAFHMAAFLRSRTEQTA